MAIKVYPEPEICDWLIYDTYVVNFQKLRENKMKKCNCKVIDNRVMFLKTIEEVWQKGYMLHVKHYNEDYDAYVHKSKKKAKKAFKRLRNELLYKGFNFDYIKERSADNKMNRYIRYIK